MSNETLDDVVLTGRVLVTDDHRQWRLPSTMAQHQSFMGWWRNLRDDDDMWHRTNLSVDKRRLLLWLTEEYAYLDSITPHTVLEIAKVRGVLRQIAAQGLTIKQMSILLARSQADVVRGIYGKPNMATTDVEARLWAERMIRHGHSDYDISSTTGLSRSEARTFRRALGVEPSENRAFPPEIRARAMALRTEGVMPAQISKILAAEGHTVSRHTISQWWARHNKEAA